MCFPATPETGRLRPKFLQGSFPLRPLPVAYRRLSSPLVFNSCPCLCLCPILVCMWRGVSCWCGSVCTYACKYLCTCVHMYVVARGQWQMSSSVACHITFNTDVFLLFKCVCVCVVFVHMCVCTLTCECMGHRIQKGVSRRPRAGAHRGW